MRGTLRYKDGNWRLMVYLGRDEATGKRHWAHRTVVADHNRAGKQRAETELARLVLEVEAGRHRAADDINVEQLLERWFTARSSAWSPGTAYQYRQLIDKRIVPRIGKLPVYKLRGADLDVMYGELLAGGGKPTKAAPGGTPLAPGTVRKVHVVMHAALKWAVRGNVIATNPADSADPPKNDEQEIKPPTPAELAKALAVAREHDPALYTFLCVAESTGARRGQVCALRWPDVDLERGVITYSRALVDGGPGVGVVEKATKTKRVYAVAVGGAALAALEEHRKTHVAVCLEAGLPADGYVFTREGSLPWRPDTTSDRWRVLRAEVGLEHVRLNGLRHYMITQMLAAGVDVRTVAGRAGHANPNMALRRYGHFMPENDRAAADVLDGITHGAG